MHIAIVGASGRTGFATLVEAQRRGWEVTALVRDPNKLRALLEDAGVPEPGIRIVSSEAASTQALQSVLPSSDAVVFALGAVRGEPAGVLESGISAVLASLGETPRPRLLVVSASGISSEGESLLMRLIVKPIVQRVLRENFADVHAMEAAARASETEWTIVRPPRLTEKPGTGRYRSRRELGVAGGWQISRADLALALADAIVDPTTIHSTISIAH